MNPKRLMSRSLALIAFASAASAQVVIPPGLEPGQIQRGLRELRVPVPGTVQVTPPAPEQVAPAHAEDIKFVLHEVRIEGATVYDASEMSAAFKLGQQISVAEVFRIANQLTARYRRDGYVL